MRTYFYLFILFFGWLNIAIAQQDSLFIKQENHIENTTYSIDSMIVFSKTFLGTKYRYGGISPKTGFDCSGFTQYVFNHFGQSINRTACEQYKQGIGIKKDSLQPGDLVFFRYRNRKKKYYIGHVGIIINTDTNHHTFDFIHCCRRGVSISNSTTNFYAKKIYGFKRFIHIHIMAKNN